MQSLLFPAKSNQIGDESILSGFGKIGDPKHTCKCSPMQIERYMGRISGPLLDRIDLHNEVPAVPYQELAARQDGTSSAVMRADVQRARDVQMRRFGGEGSASIAA
jgi:magnesium chelatase family protein